MKNSTYAISAEKEAPVESKMEARTISIPVLNYEVAKNVHVWMHQLLDDLAKTREVFVRREPEIASDYSHETGQELWIVRMRYVLGNGTPGRQSINTYDNDRVVAGFGFAPYIDKPKEDVQGRVFKTNACD